MRATILAVALWTFVIVADSIHDNTVPLVEIKPIDLASASKILKRDYGRDACDLELFNELSAAEKRDAWSFMPNTSLAERDIIIPDDPNELEAWIMSESRDVNTIRIWWRNQGDSTDVNNAAFRTFGAEPFTFSLVGLAGCTGLIIISRKAVYIAHYWENISFNLDRNWRWRYPTQEGAFRETVLRGLRQGVPGNPRAMQDALKPNVQYIDDEYITGYLVIPLTGESADGEPPPPDPYRFYWNRIKSYINQFLRRLDGRWFEYAYYPRQKEEIIPETPTTQSFDPLRNTARGRVVFKYDPNEHGMRRAVLFAEIAKLHDDVWYW